MANRQPITLDAFRDNYGRNHFNQSVQAVSFAGDFKIALERDNHGELLALTNQYAEHDPKGTFELVNEALRACQSAGLTFNDAELNAITAIAAKAINASACPDNKTQLASHFMNLLAPVAGADSNRLLPVMQLFSLVNTYEPPIDALVRMTLKQGAGVDWLQDYAADRSAQYLTTSGIEYRREAAEAVLRFADPASSAFTHGVSNIIAPVTDGEEPTRITTSQVIGIARARNTLDITVLADAMDATFDSHMRPEESNLVLITVAESLDRANASVLPEAEARITESFIRNYFELGRLVNGRARQNDLLSSFSQIEDKSTNAGIDYSAGLLGKIETRLRMVINGIERNSTLVQNLQSRGLMPATLAA